MAAQTRCRIGVVAVVNHAQAIRCKLRDGAAADRLQVFQPGFDRRWRNAQRLGSRSSRQGVGYIVLAQQVELNTRLTAGALQGKGRATTGIARQLTGVDVGGRVAQCKRADRPPLGALLPNG